MYSVKIRFPFYQAFSTEVSTRNDTIYPELAEFTLETSNPSWTGFSSETSFRLSVKSGRDGL